VRYRWGQLLNILISLRSSPLLLIRHHAPSVAADDPAIHVVGYDQTRDGVAYMSNEVR
jgi:hypothetical protein